jgi:preprotein translocase subunit SecA
MTVYVCCVRIIEDHQDLLQALTSGAVQIVPTNAPVAREDANDVVFRVLDGKWRAVMKEIKRMHSKGRPVLVGTTSVETSELVSGMLQEAGVPHEARTC